MTSLLLRRVPLALLKQPLEKSLIKVPRATITEQERSLIGSREIVGYGFNGQPVYVDLPDFPFPAIRWKEISPEICALREKEKGDWNELTCEEKKALYRASFCQTFSEFKVARLGEWKAVIGGVLMLTSAALWIFFYFHMTIYKNTPLPITVTDEERRRAVFRRMLDLRVNPIRGLGARWDYEKDDWKNPRDSWRPKSKS